MDSIDGVQLTMAVEKEFGVAISDFQLNALSTVDELVSLVEGLSLPAVQHG
jgi:acyl carrier protein